jgi:phosphomannomutase
VNGDRQADLAARLGAVVKAYDVRGLVPGELDEPMFEALGGAFVAVTSDAEGRHPGLVLGFDARPSSPGLADAFTAGATRAGADVHRIGLASTDLVYDASGTHGLPGAMITASHNPAGYNGLKVCRAGAVPIGADTGLIAMRDLAAAGALPAAERPGVELALDALPEYVAHLHRLVPLGALRPLRVVVDAGNGMAGLTVPPVLAGSAITVVPLYFELDGTFPNHPADPLDPANLRDLQAGVVTEGADLGLAFDGDADRCFVVDEQGRLIDASAVTALVAARELGRAPGSTVVHNVITSRAVPELVRGLGGRPVRARVGHSFMKAAMAEHGAVFGGEHSGHYYFRDFWNADSGMLAALHLLAALGDTPPGTAVSTLVARYQRYARSGEVNSRVPDVAAARARAEAFAAGLPDVTLDTLDGLTVEHADWWWNLRPSNTEPLLRLNVEAADPATMARVRDEVLALVREDQA